MQELLQDDCLDSLRLRGDERVLEVGCGLGRMSLELARRVPRGRVVATERCAQHLQVADVETAGEPGSERLDLRADDGSLPLDSREQGTFDLVLARHSLQCADDPASLMEELVRATRPGGRIVVADDDYAGLRLSPEIDGFDELWQAYGRELNELGTDPFIGRRLPAMLSEAGARPRRSQTIFCGGCTSDARFDSAVSILFDALLRAGERLTARDDVDADRAAQTLVELDAWRRRPDAAMWYSVCVAEGRRRVGALIAMTP